jgi:hypothetical protein
LLLLITTMAFLPRFLVGAGKLGRLLPAKPVEPCSQ